MNERNNQRSIVDTAGDLLAGSVTKNRPTTIVTDTTVTAEGDIDRLYGRMDTNSISDVDGFMVLTAQAVADSTTPTGLNGVDSEWVNARLSALNTMATDDAISTFTGAKAGSAAQRNAAYALMGEVHGGVKGGKPATILTRYLRHVKRSQRYDPAVAKAKQASKKAKKADAQTESIDASALLAALTQLLNQK